MSTSISNRSFFRLLLVLLVNAILFVSCNGIDDGGGSSNKKKALSVTIGANKITAVSASLSGKANIGSSASSDLTLGIMFSTSAGVLPSNSTKIQATNIDKDYSYSVVASGLKPGTTYYYRSYVTQDGQDAYGDTKEFKTKDENELVKTLAANPVEASKATLNAVLDINEIPGQVSYGFYYGKNENSISSHVKGEIKDNKCVATISNLTHNTTYYFKAYVKIEDAIYYGEVASFSTGSISVESVSLDQHSLTINTIGQTLTLKATVNPNDATNKTVTWSSDKPSVASVDEYGRVTAKDNGSANITVTSNDSGKKDVCKVDVKQVIKSIAFSNSAIDLYVGDAVTISYTITPDNAYDKTLNWTTSDSKIATVNSAGKVTAVAQGTAVIKATAKDNSNQSASCTITVKKHITGITLDYTSLTLYTGKTQQLKATVQPSNADVNSISWTSSNSNVATVSSSGVVEGIREGTATITASANDGSGVKATCKVTVVLSVSDIIFNSENLGLVEGDVVTLNYSISPSNAYNKAVTWTSSNTSIVTVNSNGKITALKKGKATITAVAQDGSGAYGTCFIIVSRKCPSNAVDLGLTNKDGYKVYWAKCNVGASSPEGIGNYYAWGETETKSTFSKETYKWYQNSKYVNPGGLSDISRSEYDVAHVKMGSEWHLPNLDDQQTLNNGCTWVKTTLNGVVGLKGTGPNGNTIFFPYTGYKNKNGLTNENFSGFYWESWQGWSTVWDAAVMQITVSNTTAGNIPNATYRTEDRSCGLCVRGVYD